MIFPVKINFDEARAALSVTRNAYRAAAAATSALAVSTQRRTSMPLSVSRVTIS